ncbi:MAG: lysozyme inhibitor LprI family protein, partial [Verrucomicrobiota bacterium]
MKIPRVEWLIAIAIGLWMIPLAEGEEGRFDSADRALNERYGMIVKRLSPKAVAALRDSQRTWIELRDANAALIAAMPPGGSTMDIQKALDTEYRLAFLSAKFLNGEQSQGDADATALGNADQLLNQEYRQLLASLTGDQGKLLQQAQRIWVTSRDLDFATEVAAGLVTTQNAAWAELRKGTQLRRIFLSGLRGQALGLLKPVPNLMPTAPKVGAPGPEIVANDVAASNLMPTAPKVGAPSRESTTDSVNLKPIPGIKPQPLVKPSTQPNQIFTRITPSRVYSRIMLDMREMLLVGISDLVIDFWDVQTGALIRTLHSEDQSRAITNLGGGLVAVQSFARRSGNLEIFDRNSDARRLVIGDAADWLADPG